MKNFEEKFEQFSCELDIDCGSMECEECKSIAEYWHRQALEFAENQFVGRSAFEAEEAINKELRE